MSRVYGETGLWLRKRITSVKVQSADRIDFFWLKSGLTDTGIVQEDVNAHPPEMLLKTFLEMENRGLHSSLCLFLVLWAWKKYLPILSPSFHTFKNKDNNTSLTVFGSTLDETLVVTQCLRCQLLTFLSGSVLQLDSFSGPFHLHDSKNFLCYHLKDSFSPLMKSSFWVINGFTLPVLCLFSIISISKNKIVQFPYPLSPPLSLSVSKQ